MNWLDMVVVGVLALVVVLQGKPALTPVNTPDPAAQAQRFAYKK